MLSFCKGFRDRVSHIIPCGKNVLLCIEGMSTIEYHGKERPFNLQSHQVVSDLAFVTTREFSADLCKLFCFASSER